MTEEQWFSCMDPTPMLKFLRASGKLSERRARLFAVAVCRRIWRWMTDERVRRAVESVERFAEGWADEQEIRQTRYEARRIAALLRVQLKAGSDEERWLAFLPCRAAANATRPDSFLVARETAEDALRLRVTEVMLSQKGGKPQPTLWTAAMRDERTHQCHLLRDLFGNPFRPAAIDPSCLAWNDGAVGKLAHVIYDERAFDRLPLLADALEDAGCTDKDILAYCREEGAVHVRGCWIIDLLLGKS